MDNQQIYQLETPDEKKLRYIITGVLGIAFLGFSYFMLPYFTKMVTNWIDFGIKFGQLCIIVGIFATIWIMRDILIFRWKSFVNAMTRKIVQTDLPGLLEVVVQNRRAVLASFGKDVKKMMEVIISHTNKIEARKESMQKNLSYAQQYQKKAVNQSLSQHERDKYGDSVKHFAKEAAEDEKVLKAMQSDKEKMIKSYNFFDRLYSNLERSTESVSNSIERLRDQLETSSIWKEASSNAVKLLGVSQLETLTLDETRIQIAKNESEVMSMIRDHESLLMKMEAENGVIDEAGQQLLENYSNKVDVFAFLTPAQGAQRETLSNTSWLTAHKDLIDKVKN